jgi:hypothetical protein
MRSTTQLPPHHNLEKPTHHHQNYSGTVVYAIKHPLPHDSHPQYYYILSFRINFMEGKDALKHKEEARKGEEN